MLANYNVKNNGRFSEVYHGSPSFFGIRYLRRLLTKRMIFGVACLMALQLRFTSKVRTIGRRLQVVNEDEDDDGSIFSGEEAGIKKSRSRYGSHYVAFYIGGGDDHDGQRQQQQQQQQHMNLSVALGSDYVSLPCLGCDIDGEQVFTNTFDPENSTIPTCPEECAFPDSKCQEGDGDKRCMVSKFFPADNDLSGGYKAFELNDTVRFETEDVNSVMMTIDSSSTSTLSSSHLRTLELKFLCKEEITDLIPDDTNVVGILGLSSAESSFINQLHSNGLVVERVFGLCFQDFTDHQPPGTSAGSIMLGGINREIHSSPLVWARNTAVGRDYAVHVRRIHMGLGGGTDPLLRASMSAMTMMSLNASSSGGGNAIGVTDTEEVAEALLAPIPSVIQTNVIESHLSKNFADPFNETFFLLTGHYFLGTGINVTRDEFDRLPTVFLQLEASQASQMDTQSDLPGFVGIHDARHPFDVLLAIPPSRYMVYHYDVGAAYPSIYFSDDDYLSVGANLLLGHDVVFDLERSRIGFAETSSCPGGIDLLPEVEVIPAVDPNPKGEVVTADGEDEEGGSGLSHILERLRARASGGRNDTNDTSSDPNEELVVQHASVSPGMTTGGLPAAVVGSAARVYRPGPAATEGLEALKGKSDSSGFWHLGGFLLFLIGFSVTAIATRDRDSDRMITSKKTDAEESLLYSGGGSGGQAVVSKRRPWQYPKAEPQQGKTEPRPDLTSSGHFTAATSSTDATPTRERMSGFAAGDTATNINSPHDDPEFHDRHHHNNHDNRHDAAEYQNARESLEHFVTKPPPVLNSDASYYPDSQHHQEPNREPSTHRSYHDNSYQMIPEQYEDEYTLPPQDEPSVYTRGTYSHHDRQGADSSSLPSRYRQGPYDGPQEQGYANTAGSREAFYPDEPQRNPYEYGVMS